MNYLYDAVLTKEDHGYTVHFPQFPGVTVQAKTRRKAVLSAAEELSSAITNHLEQGMTLPSQDRTVECFTVNVSVDRNRRDMASYMTMKEACEILGVGKTRVSTLANRGQLEARYFEGARMISVASVEAYAASPRKAGRPRKQDSPDKAS